MARTTVRTNLALNGGLRLQEVADLPKGAKPGATCFRDGVLYVRGDLGGAGAWFPINAPQGHHVHTQGAPARVWEVNHGFAGTAAIMAYDEAGDALPATIAASEGMASVDVGEDRTGYAVSFGLVYATADQGAKADSAVQPEYLSEAIAPLAAAKVEIMEREVVTASRLSSLEDSPYTQRWPSFDELADRPDLGSAAYEDASSFASASHSHAWGDLSGVPATASRWPSFGEVTDKPTAYPPEAHHHDGRYLRNAGQVAGGLYADHSLSTNEPGFFFHSTGGSPSDSPTGGQSSVLHLPNSWGNPYIAIPNGGDGLFWRNGNSTDWRRALHSGSSLDAGRLTGTVPDARLPTMATRWPAWSEVTSRPSTFPPASHGHSVSDISGLSDAATTSVSAIRSGTTKGNVGLGSVRNVSSYSQSEADDNFAPKSHNHNGHHALESDLSNALTQLADAFNQGADEIAAVTIQDYSRHL